MKYEANVVRIYIARSTSRPPPGPRVTLVFLMSPSTLAFPEELLHNIVLFLDDVEDHEREYPKSLYRYVSRDIYMLSLVSHQFRRICFPLLFSYIKCTSLQELNRLENECLATVSFAGNVRTLEVDAPELLDLDTLIRLIHRLDSLVWLELGKTEMTPALLAAIDAHSSLETAAIFSLRFVPPNPALLDKVLLHVAGRQEIMEVQRRHIGLVRLRVGRLSFPLETVVVRDLRHVHFSSMSEVASTIQSLTLDRFQEFISHHPTLTTLSFRSAWKDCSFSKQYISRFLDALGEQYPQRVFLGFSVVRAPIKSDCDIGFHCWEVTGLSFDFDNGIVSSDSVSETLSLAGTMFPKVTSLMIFYHAGPMHVDTFLALLSKHFPNLRTLYLSISHELLTLTPFLVPTNLESENPMEDTVACVQWLAWHLFQGLPSLLKIDAHERSHHVNQFSSFHATYRPQRDFSRAVIEMKIESLVENWDPRGNDDMSREFIFRGLVAL
ncbi:hypothetical protein C8J56DRAFT_421962 [Mycena floridula]|nr:hypothetical protein C8J56DRAFT_421962 [Mycena floridula]